MTPAEEEFFIVLETSTASTRTVITLKGDGTAEHRDDSRVDRRQRVEVKEVHALLKALLDARFFEQRNVVDQPFLGTDRAVARTGRTCPRMASPASEMR